jgi:hypothetical protein
MNRFGLSEIEVRPVIRINLGYVFQLANSLEALSKLDANDTWGDSIFPILQAHSELEGLLGGSVFTSGLITSRQSGQILWEKLNEALEYDYGDEWNKPIGPIGFAIANAYKQFKVVLLAEVSVLPAYYVSREGGYDPLSLLDNGAAVFPKDLLSKVPEAELDVAEATKALAFQVSTACGFHVFRICEAVVRRYWDETSEGKDRPKLQTLGNFDNEMEKKDIGDKKVVECLKQMNKLHRNPIIHPEVILTQEEALGIIGIARSLISAMLVHLPVVPPTTGGQSQPSE